MPFYIAKGYSLPPTSSKSSLHFFISYSGNSEETVSCFSEAISRGLPSIAFATGGKLEEMSKKSGTQFVKIPKGIQPRCSTGHLLASQLIALANSGIIPEQGKALQALSNELSGFPRKAEAKALASQLIGKLPVIYAPEDLRTLSFVWKIKFNENAKVQAFSGELPDMNHNDMSGYLGTKGLHAIFLRDPNSHAKIRSRMEATKSIIESTGNRASIIEMQGPTRLSRMMSCVYFADWASYSLAELLGTDPEPVELQEAFKKRIQQA